MLYRAYSVSFVCMEICIGCIGFVCERKWKNNRKKNNFSPTIEIFGRKTKKNRKKNNNSGGGGVLCKNAGLANFKSLDGT